jgi:hypothetical protein
MKDEKMKGVTRGVVTNPLTSPFAVASSVAGKDKLNSYMISILLAWLYISLLCWSGGWLFTKLISDKFGVVGADVPRTLYPFLGLAWISGCTALISLIAPIRWEWNFLFLGIVVLGALWKRDEFWEDLCAQARVVISKPWVPILLTVVAVVLLLKCASSIHEYGTAEAVFHSDTGYYHAQSIRWIEEYGVVPGLGNLLAPLAIDYLWFQPCALFGFAVFLPQRMHAMGGIVVLWGVAFALGGALGLSKSLRSGSLLSHSDLFRLLMLFPLVEIGNYAAADSGDEPAALMCLIAIASALLVLERTVVLATVRQTLPAGSVSRLFCLVLLVAFSVAIKLSLLPLLLLPFFLLVPWFRAVNWRIILGVFLIGGVILGPKIIRSVLLSGYLLYPLPQVDFFSVDWKMPKDVLLSEKGYVESMARIRFVEPGAILNGGMGVWLGPWIRHFFSTPIGVAVATSMLSLSLQIFWFRDRLARLLRSFWPVYATVAIGIAYWFLMAPDPRFGYGFLSAGCILCLVTWEKGIPLTRLLSGEVWRLLLALGAFLFLLATTFSIPRMNAGDSFGKGVIFSDYYRRFLKRVHQGEEDLGFLWFQDPYPKEQMLHLSIGSLQLWRPNHGMRCWDAEVPATPFVYHRIELRGKNLHSGFRVCDGSVEQFSGMRLSEEYQEALKNQNAVNRRKTP